ncbi:DJ-1/PfpI family protein [Pelagibacterium limicola]|uniref:DJ-1/PfpI family protein n=1 Tax=Pelagibacterium limicola TaxID=2791022 RepID=UPI0018AFA456|nr:DJ-1/PfpI family protein [Pelagibacterium limicola]
MTKLAIVFTEGYADWECAHIMAAGREHFAFDIFVATPEGKPVTSLGGVRVLPDGAFEAVDADDFDGLVICGGTIWRTPAAPDLAAVVEAFTHAGKLVAAICDGVLGLARTGRLDGVSHTGNAAEALFGAPGYAGEKFYLETPRAVRADGVVTASGTAAVSFMAEVFRALGFGGADLDIYLDMLAAEHR